MAINRWQRRRRRNKVQCVSCGYDLRATPERCPECGKLAALPSNAPARNPADGAGRGSAGASAPLCVRR
jgi:hypothetical protein